ncbi:hypothetical protein HMPREF2832_08710 [Streptococcus sp. HMSC073D05]|jgi:hypothetical protein|uniref:Uncharacterized protein n=1 Tax=Streptococcus parasanguinis TaxID=1318 RepID=A0A6I3P2P0_STRPA|nr:MULTISPECIES: hypothetical protein [Streptococcus]MBT0906607.1 hypothetical protein [Streptococcus parasanguinis]MTR40427.1 hypothetical protein [Streptococcus parasanguinis]OFK09087.1 hypothetical protein HMPREF2832_08710 [Streptococcus sp. HMSC073D05]
MKARRSIWVLIALSLGVVFCFIFSKPVNADIYNVGNYTVTENGNVISATNQETGLSAYLNRDTGLLTDIDGTLSYVDINNDNGADYIPAFSSTDFLVASGLRPGVWNYVTTVTYNLGYLQSVQSFILGLIALIPSPASSYTSGASLALGGASLVNSKVTVKLTQYYDPAQSRKIKEVVVTYSNGRKVGSTSYVRDIFLNLYYALIFMY